MHLTHRVFDRYHIVTPADPQEAPRKLADTVHDTVTCFALDGNAASVQKFRVGACSSEERATAF